MHRVLEHVDAHLDRPLELNELAEVAHFSPFHFHRLFSAWMGETLGEYLRRRRLELAAVRLVVQPRAAVLSIALSVGFGSAEAFARAFKVRFRCTPSAWRRLEAARRARERRALHRNPDQAFSNPDQAFGNPDQDPAVPGGHDGTFLDPFAEAPMNVKIVERQPAKVAYLRYVGPYGQPVSEFWQARVYPWMVTNSLLGRPRYGVSLDDPGVTAPEKCRYDAGVELPAGFSAGRDCLTTTIAGGKYAEGAFRGKVADIGEAWNALLRDWLPASGMQLDGRPCFEYYPPDAGYDAHTGIFSCSIVIPLAPL